jgi:hypothetical protein
MNKLIVVLALLTPILLQPAYAARDHQDRRSYCSHKARHMNGHDKRAFLKRCNRSHALRPARKAPEPGEPHLGR